MQSPSEDTIALFMSLFTGREDVYAKCRENAKKEKSDYSPDCFRAWSPICPKSGKAKVKCGECTKQRFVPFDAQAVEKHLKGKPTIGVYPMLPDETCRFLAFDFDAKVYVPAELRRDVSAIREVCAEPDIHMAVERSRSGNDIHFWIFFAENAPVNIARKFGSSLIAYAMNKHHELPFKTYDRLIPTQDSLPKGGFGNLIALPLQKYSRKQDNSVFVDDNFNPYADQWNYLHNVKKYTLTEIEKFIRQLTPDGELGELHRASDSEDEKPWENKKTVLKPAKLDFPEKVKVVHANMLCHDKI